MSTFISLDSQVPAPPKTIIAQLEDDMIKKSQPMEGSRSCVCSPTKHPGSFRCRHHRNPLNQSIASGPSAQSPLRSEAVGGLDLASIKIEGAEGK